MDRFNSMRATSSSPFQETDPTVPAWVKAISQADIARWDVGGGGTDDYTDLENKPSINGVTLSGNKTSSDLGISDVIEEIGALSLEDGTDISLTLSKYYKISSLTVNGTVDSKFANAIIYVFQNANNQSIVSLIAGNDMSTGTVIQLGKQYKYVSGEWSVTMDKHIEYSSTDLTAGTSPLPTGSFYFVYE